MLPPRIRGRGRRTSRLFAVSAPGCELADLMLEQAASGLAVALLVTPVQPASWFVQRWPERQLAAVRDATCDPGKRLYATDGTADWLLWRIPGLRGRTGCDVRFAHRLARNLSSGARIENLQKSPHL